MTKPRSIYIGGTIHTPPTLLSISFRSFTSARPCSLIPALHLVDRLLSYPFSISYAQHILTLLPPDFPTRAVCLMGRLLPFFLAHP